MHWGLLRGHRTSRELWWWSRARYRKRHREMFKRSIGTRTHPRWERITRRSNFCPCPGTGRGEKELRPHILNTSTRRRRQHGRPGLQIGLQPTSLAMRWGLIFIDSAPRTRSPGELARSRVLHQGTRTAEHLVERLDAFTNEELRRSRWHGETEIRVAGLYDLVAMLRLLPAASRLVR